MACEQTVSRWHELGAKIFREMEDWHQAHPRATFAEIEAAVEDRLGGLRAELIEEGVATRAGLESTGSDRPHCGACGHPMEARGARERAVTVRGNRVVRVRRRYLACPACGAGFFPPG